MHVMLSPPLALPTACRGAARRACPERSRRGGLRPHSSVVCLVLAANSCRKGSLCRSLKICPRVWNGTGWRGAGSCALGRRRIIA